MTRLAVFSDIHGNLTAFDAALDDLRALGGADEVWVLGDLAAFGARPTACVRRTMTLHETLGMDEKRVRTIGGNTDRYLVNGVRMRSASAKDDTGLNVLRGFLRLRDDNLNWALDQLGFVEYDFLRKIRFAELSLDVQGYGSVIGYHGAPGDDEKVLAPDTPAEEVLDALLDREGRLGIGGHTHRPMDRTLGRWRVVNAGSVGLAEAAGSCAEWVLLTFADGTAHVDLRCTPYDVEAELAAIDAAGFPHPQWLAGRIRP